MGGVPAFEIPELLWGRRLEERAVRERWPMSEEVRERILARLMRTMDDGDASHRETTSAAKALIGADRLNLQAEELELLERIELLEEADERRDEEAGEAAGGAPPAARSID